MRVRLETSQPYRKLLVHFQALNLHHRLSDHLTSLNTWQFWPYFMVDIARYLQNCEEVEVMFWPSMSLNLGKTFLTVLC